MEIINAADAKRRLLELLSRVKVGERLLIQHRDRSVAALISADELDRLERNVCIALRLAMALGQDEQLLEAIGKGVVQPTMAVFSLRRDNPDTDDRIEHPAANRRNQPTHPAPEL